MRLGDLWDGDLTHQELIAYIDALPRESATSRALLGENAEWTSVLHRLTDVADLLIEGHHIAIAAAGGKPGKPKPLPRPRFQTEAERAEYRAEMDARLEEIKELNEARAAETASTHQLETDDGG